MTREMGKKVDSPDHPTVPNQETRCLHLHYRFCL
jgi:hypothetical protein